MSDQSGARTATLRLPYLAPNLNDLIRDTNAASAARGVVHYQSRVLRKKRGRIRVKDRYAERKAQWSTRVKAHVLEQRIEPFARGAHVSFDIVEPTRTRDPDNFCSATAKFVLDGLVNSGVLPNDGWKGVHSLSFAWSQGERPCVSVTLEDPKE